MDHLKRIILTLLALLALVISVGPRAPVAVAATATYTITDLGTTDSALFQDINRAGHVVGEAWISAEAKHAVLYDGASRRDLGSIGGTYSGAFGINDSGQVVGTSDTGTGAQHAFLSDGSGLQDLGTLGGTYSYARAINTTGRIVGSSSTEHGYYHAFLYDGSMRDLGTLGGRESHAQDINDAGQVVGYAFNSSDEQRAFLYDGSSMRDLGTLGGPLSFAYGINTAGQVVGNAYTSSGAQHAFLYDGRMQDLGTLGGAYSHAYDINDAGEIVGESNTAEPRTHAFLYKHGVMVDLNSLIPSGSGWELLQAKAINAQGQILGQGYFTDANGRTLGHTFLLTPSAPVEPTPPTPVPTLTGVEPSYALAGMPDLTIRVVGDAFTSTSTVRWDDTWDLATTWIDNHTLQAVVPASYLTYPGTFAITVYTPPGIDGVGGGASGALPFYISYPPPVVSSIMPNSAVAGTPKQEISIVGANFAPTSRAYIDGWPITIVSHSPNVIQGFIPADALVYARTAVIHVVTPNDKENRVGGASGPFPFFVTETPASVSDASTATSSAADGTAEATMGGTGSGTPGSVTAIATGQGTISVAQYTDNPVTTPSPAGTTNYFDVYVALDSTFSKITVVNCNLSGGNTLYWWNEQTAAWEAVSEQSYDPNTACITATITSGSSPNLLQLTGTPFAAMRDVTPPTLNVSGAASGPFDICAIPSPPSFNPSDAGSGLDGTQDDSWTTPPTASGVGTYTYRAQARDLVGNEAKEVRTYTVKYGAAYTGILQPVNADGSSRFKLGSTIPVKFQLLCNGTPVTGAVAKLTVRKDDGTPDPGVDEAISNAAATSGNSFRYDGASQQYIFNLATKSSYLNPGATTATAFSPGTWTLGINFDDGTSQTVRLQLVK